MVAQPPAALLVPPASGLAVSDWMGEVAVEAAGVGVLNLSAVIAGWNLTAEARIEMGRAGRTRRHLGEQYE